MTLPTQTPLQIHIKGQPLQSVYILPRDTDLLNQLGEFEWCEWPETQVARMETV